jgi:hypothetical protein
VVLEAGAFLAAVVFAVVDLRVVMLNCPIFMMAALRGTALMGCSNPSRLWQKCKM